MKVIADAIIDALLIAERIVLSMNFPWYMYQLIYTLIQYVYSLIHSPVPGPPIRARYEATQYKQVILNNGVD